MNKRNCPVCDLSNAEVIMKFTPELLSAKNKTYKIEELTKSLKGQENALTYSKCNDCGMIYCESLWDDITLKNIYQNTIDHDKSKNKVLSIKKRMMLLNTFTNILRILTLRGERELNDLKIIDYGCGWGDFLDVVNGYGVDALGYDEDTQKTALPLKRGHRITNSTDEVELFAPVDVFVMNSVLEHIQDTDYIIKLAKKLLKPNGLLVFSVMDYRPKFIKKNIAQLRNNQVALTKNLNPVEHVNIYNYKSVMRTLKKYRFNLISTRHVLYFLDTYFLRNNKLLIHLFNKIEWLSANLLSGKELGIQIYASNQK
jgi:2-polyprenyl-3-methyl-5-hydroxy-6-metoxy-1,4-benzoquinol methylase